MHQRRGVYVPQASQMSRALPPVSRSWIVGLKPTAAAFFIFCALTILLALASQVGLERRQARQPYGCCHCRTSQLGLLLSRRCSDRPAGVLTCRLQPGLWLSSAPCRPCMHFPVPPQALGVAVSAACPSEKVAFAVAPGITVVLMLFGKLAVGWAPACEADTKKLAEGWAPACEGDTKKAAGLLTWQPAARGWLLSCAGGFFVTYDSIPVWIRWLCYLSHLYCESAERAHAVPGSDQVLRPALAGRLLWLRRCSCVQRSSLVFSRTLATARQAQASALLPSLYSEPHRCLHGAHYEQLSGPQRLDLHHASHTQLHKPVRRCHPGQARSAPGSCAVLPMPASMFCGCPFWSRIQPPTI